MAVTETIPTKFPDKDVRIIDRLVNRGSFISRSDLIRQATREKIKEQLSKKNDYDIFINKMKEKGDFNSLEGKVLSRIFLEKNKTLTLKDFTEAEQKAIRKILRHPFGILKTNKSVLELTDNGISAARGYLKALTHLKTLE